MYMYDWSQPATVQAWANGVANAVKKGGFDGSTVRQPCSARYDCRGSSSAPAWSRHSRTAPPVGLPELAWRHPDGGWK